MPDRRSFLAGSVAMGAAFALPAHGAPAPSPLADVNLVGPKEGYSPQVGTLVSMLTWMRKKVLRYPQGLSQKDLDHLFDQKANSIGALLLHLAATEAYYQTHTFDNVKWGAWP
jgi:hypothetical protein